MKNLNPLLAWIDFTDYLSIKIEFCDYLKGSLPKHISLNNISLPDTSSSGNQKV